MPAWALLATAWAFELGWRVAPGKQTASPPITRLIVGNVCDDFWFSSERARRELGYAPVVDETVARVRTLAWLRNEWLPAELRARASSAGVRTPM